jgi:hypothetical protein
LIPCEWIYYSFLEIVQPSALEKAGFFPFRRSMPARSGDTAGIIVYDDGRQITLVASPYIAWWSRLINQFDS